MFSDYEPIKKDNCPSCGHEYCFHRRYEISLSYNKNDIINKLFNCLSCGYEKCFCGGYSW